MKLRRRLRVIPESILIVLALVLIPPLPRRAVVALARLLGSIAIRVAVRLRRITLANLEAAFGDEKTERERFEIAEQSFRTFALVLLDVFWFGLSTERRMKRYASCDPSVNSFLSPGAKIGISGHFGNWEISGLLMAMMGCPTTSVAASFRNPLVSSVLGRARRKTGQRVIAQRGAVKELLTTLRGGGRIALVMDQNTLPGEGGEYVDFFGLPVPMAKTASSLAERTGAPVIFVYTVVDDRGHYRCYALLEIQAKPDSMVGTALTQAIARQIENTIRKYPGQWLWMYRRWNYVPEDRSREGYPFYARKRSEPRKKW